MPYSLFILCGMVFWTFFSNSLALASDSMVSNEGIIKKVYFPKIILPFSSIFIGGIDFSINFIILLVFALFLGFVPSIWIFVVVPLAILATSITVIGAGLLFASINVKYRDVRYVLPFFIQTLMFITPVIYPLDIVAPQKRYLMAINPMTSVIESVRLVFSGGGFLDPWLILISVLSMFTILIIGIWYFRKTERFFADIV
jgi:lipopolysaccharide transport system permease protein